MAKQAASRTPSSGSRKKAAPPAVLTAAAAAERVALKPEPSHAQIAERAYGLWLSRGAHEGDAMGDWIRAEHELRAQN